MAGSKEALAGESVLARWSRRKLQVDKDPGAGLPAVEQGSADALATAPADAEAKPLTDADMPAVETLTEESDFSAFMSSGVSDKLRNLALRKLFQAPQFNICDGLDDYNEDYTSFETLGDIVTSDMKHQLQMQQQKLREAQELEQRNTALEETASEDVEASADEDDAGIAGADASNQDLAGSGEAAIKTAAKTETEHA